MTAAIEFLTQHATLDCRAPGFRRITPRTCEQLRGRPEAEKGAITGPLGVPPMWRPGACDMCPNNHKSGPARTGPAGGISRPAQRSEKPAAPHRGSGAEQPEEGPPPTPRPKKRLPLTKQSFSARLRLARENADIGQSDLGKSLGIPQSHISAAEAGRQLNRTYTNKLRAWVARQEGSK